MCQRVIDLAAFFMRQDECEHVLTKRAPLRQIDAVNPAAFSTKVALKKMRVRNCAKIIAYGA